MKVRSVQPGIPDILISFDNNISEKEHLNKNKFKNKKN